jgi:hypothetical protein
LLFSCPYPEQRFRIKPACNEAWPEQPHMNLFC